MRIFITLAILFFGLMSCSVNNQMAGCYRFYEPSLIEYPYLYLKGARGYIGGTGFELLENGTFKQEGCADTFSSGNWTLENNILTLTYIEGQNLDGQLVKYDTLELLNPKTEFKVKGKSLVRYIPIENVPKRTYHERYKRYK